MDEPSEASTQTEYTLLTVHPDERGVVYGRVFEDWAGAEFRAAMVAEKYPRAVVTVVQRDVTYTGWEAAYV